MTPNYPRGPGAKTCNHPGCTKTACPGRPRCRLHQVCQTTGCKVKKANYYNDLFDTWHCAKHVHKLWI